MVGKEPHSGRGTIAYAPYGACLGLYKTKRNAVGAKDATPAANSSSMLSKVLQRVMWRTSNSKQDVVAAPVDATGAAPLRDFLFPVLGNPEGVYFSRSRADVEDAFGVSHGDVLEYTVEPLQGARVVVVGARGGVLWVTDADDGAKHARSKQARPMRDLNDVDQPLTKALLLSFVQRVAKASITEVEPPSIWTEEVQSFLMFAPDLSIVQQQRDETRQVVVLCPVVTWARTPVLGWAGEQRTSDEGIGSSLWCASVSIPPQ